MDLAEYTRNSDRNKFWKLPSGVAQNLLDEAIDRITDLEAQLAAAQERGVAYAEYKRKLEAIVMWLERNEPSVFARGLWDAINNPPEQEDTDENSSH